LVPVKVTLAILGPAATAMLVQISDATTTTPPSADLQWFARTDVISLDERDCPKPNDAGLIILYIPYSPALGWVWELVSGMSLKSLNREINRFAPAGLILRCAAVAESEPPGQRPRTEGRRADRRERVP
jgi:hypothetical protein